MSSRGHPGYWLVFAVAAGGTLGLLVLLGVDNAMRKPWAAIPAVVGVVAAEMLAANILGWEGPDDTMPGSTRGSLVALLGVPVALLVATGSLILYSATDSPIAAWAAVLALLAMVGCVWAADWVGRRS